MEQPVFMHALWMPACLHRSTKKHIVMFMRSGERLDRVLGENWKATNTKNGRLFRTDANMPADLRALKYSSLESDSPITPYGRFVCAAIANGIRNRRLVPDYIVSSPAFRAIQSASAVADVLHLNVHVDDDLCEPFAWYKDCEPKYLGYNHLVSCGLPVMDPDRSCLFHFDGSPVSANARAIAPKKRRYEALRDETEAESMERIQRTLRKYFEQPRHGPLLIVGHAITLAMALKIAEETQAKADERLGAIKKTRQQPSESNSASSSLPSEKVTTSSLAVDFFELGIKFPHSCLLATTQVRDSSGELLVYELPNLIPSFTISPTLSNDIDLRL